MNQRIIIIIPVLCFFCLGFLTPGIMSDLLLFDEIHKKESYEMHFASVPVKDTIFIFSSKYIEISLSKQIATVVFRNDSSVSFKVSSGTSRLEKGLDTPTGIYTVQSKSQLAISKQFDNAEMFNWIGFNGNIGIHSLKGKAYYRRLGRYPSSHGCVRISKEDGEKLYNMVKRGTPVFVFDKEPARIIVFAEPYDFNPNTDIFLESSGISQSRILNRRLTSLYKGNFYNSAFGRIFLSDNTILRCGGLPIGEADKIAIKQKIPLKLDNRNFVRNDVVKYKSLLKFSSADSADKAIYISSDTLRHTSL